MKNKFEIRGDVTVIFLQKRNGKQLETIIDTNDLARVDEFPGKWYAILDPKSNKFYVYGGSQPAKSMYRWVKLHRWLMNEPEGKVIDHFNHDTLDNRRSCNLRAVTQLVNNQNNHLPLRNNSSGFRGVSWDKTARKWRAQISVLKQVINLGRFNDPSEAHEAYLTAKAKYHKTEENQNA